MPLTVLKISECKRETWLEFWQASKWATYFESPEWCAQWAANHPNCEAHAFIIRFSDNAELIFPGVITTRSLRMFRIFEGSPGGTYGGPLSMNPFTNNHILLAINAISDYTSAFFYRLNPFLPHIDPLILGTPASGNLHVHHDFTQALDLRMPDNELKDKLREKRIPVYARKAFELGFAVRKLTPDDSHRFAEVYAEASSRWPAVNIRYSDSFFKTLIHSKGCDFWGCFSPDNQLSGAGLLLRGSHVVTSWLLLVRPSALPHRLAETLYHSLIWHYRESGFSWFDFNPSAGNDGVVDFKEKFGTQKRPSSSFQSTSWLYQIYTDTWDKRRSLRE